METLLQLIAAFGVGLSLYGTVQLATRPVPVEAEDDELSPFWRWLYRIVFRGDVPDDSGDSHYTSRRTRVGWRCLVTGFLIQLLGSAALAIVQAVKLAN